MDLRAIALGIAFAAMWSSAFASAKMIVADAPPMTALALRFLISGILGCGIALMLGQSWRLDRAQWRSTFIFGLCQNALYLGLNFIAMQRVDAGLAAIIASTMPLLVAFAGWSLLGQRLRPMGVLGLGAGFLGVALIMGTRLSGGVDIMGVALCVAGAVALTIATLSVSSASAGGNVLMVVGLQMLVGAVILSVGAVAFETWDVTWTPRLAGAFAYTTVVPGLIATFTWFVLVGRIGAVRAATFHFLNPFFGVAVAAMLLGERIGPFDILGVGIIMGGILAVQLAKARPVPRTGQKSVL